MEDEKNADIIDIYKLQEAARNASAYYREQHSFQRNAKLTWLVHAIFNAAQFFTALMDELFHLLHHYIHRTLTARDPTIPDLPEERNPAFYVYPVCMCISIILCILWLSTRILERNLGKTAIACALGSVLMMIGAIVAMRHAEIHINLNEVSDEELLDHPIFIHNFVLCIISIFGMNIYLMQAWILFDTWQWMRKNHASESSSGSETEVSGNSETSASSYGEDSQKIKPVSEIKDLPKLTKSYKNPQDEPVTLYCACLDCWNYIKMSMFSKEPIHEFHVIHVM